MLRRMLEISCVDDVLGTFSFRCGNGCEKKNDVQVRERNLSEQLNIEDIAAKG